MRSGHELSRRSFIAGAGALAIGAGFGSVAAEGNYTAAIIGHTGAGDYGHGLDAVFKGLPRVRTVALSDANAAGREKIRQQSGAAKAYADYREMLAAEKPNLVSVAPRWTQEHFEMVNAALQAGAHVFCEKPFTTTLQESDRLLKLAGKKNLKIVVAHQMRMAPNVQRLRSEVANGLIGEIVHMRAYGKQDARAGGEDMIVLGTHQFDLMRLFAGDARRCSATIWSQGGLAKRDDPKKATEGIGYILGDEIEAQFEFDRGVIGHFTSRGKLREAIGHWRLELVGTKGSSMILMDIDPTVRILKEGGWTDFASVTDAEKGVAAANRRLALDWLEAIESNREPSSSGANAAKAVEMCMAVYEAHLAGRRVEFPLATREHPLGT